MAPKPRTKRVFISDIHLSLPTSWSWFPYGDGGTHITALNKFFEHIGAQEDVKDLILLGDIFDDWVCPRGETPPSVATIMRHPSNKPVMNVLRQIAGGPINLIYTNGNHDMDVGENLLTKEIPGIIYAGRSYTSRPVYAEHGHAFTIFNSRDPGMRRSLGYFITRILTRKEGKEISTFKVLRGVVDDALEAIFTAQTLPTSVFEAVMEEAAVGDDDQIVLPNGSAISCGTIKDRYRDLLELWTAKKGMGTAYRMLRGDMGGLEWFGDRVANTAKFRAVVFGHTHDPLLDKDRFGSYDHVYANSGTWRHKKKRTFVEVDKQSSQIGVKLCEWKWDAGAGTGAVVTKKSKSVNR